MNAVLAHIILVVAVLAAYVVLTVTGHDANPVLGVLVGQAAAGGIQAATASKP